MFSSLSAYANDDGAVAVQNDAQQQYHQLRPLSLESSNSDSNSSSIFEFKHLDLNGGEFHPSVGNMSTNRLIHTLTEQNRTTDKIMAIAGSSGKIASAAGKNAIRLVIKEQPVDKFRFRYKSEMHGTHGSLTGQTSNSKHKTYPAVELVGFSGAAIVRCSLHQTGNYRGRPHSHSLVVRNNSEDQRDPHDVHVGVPNSGYGVAFAGMGIIHTAKKFIVEELYEKLLARYRWENAPKLEDGEGDGGVDANGETELVLERLRVQAENEAKLMNLNQVCLCFEAFGEVQLPDGGVGYRSLCEPVYSHTINNMSEYIASLDNI